MNKLEWNFRKTFRQLFTELDTLCNGEKIIKNATRMRNDFRKYRESENQMLTKTGMHEKVAMVIQVTQIVKHYFMSKKILS